MSNQPVPENAIHPAELAIDTSLRFSKGGPHGMKTLEQFAGSGSPGEIILRLGSKIARESRNHGLEVLDPFPQFRHRVEQALWRNQRERARVRMAHEGAKDWLYLGVILENIDPRTTIKVHTAKGTEIPMRSSTGFTGQETVVENVHNSTGFPTIPSGEMIVGGTAVPKDQLRATIYGNPGAKFHPQYESLQRPANPYLPELVVRLPLVDRQGVIHLVALNEQQFNRLQGELTK
jgi:hypothetical protein